MNLTKNGKHTKRYKKLLLESLRNIALFLGVLYVVFSYFNKNYVINVTASLPIGIYKLEKIDNEINKGDIVLFQAKNNINNFMLERGYISKRIKSFIKRVEGIKGDTIDVGNFLEVNGKKIKESLPKKDLLGRDLKRKDGTYTLKANEYFLVGDKINSFDSSYMGIIKRDQIKYKANLVLKWGL